MKYFETEKVEFSGEIEMTPEEKINELSGFEKMFFKIQKLVVRFILIKNGCQLIRGSHFCFGIICFVFVPRGTVRV